MAHHRAVLPKENSEVAENVLLTSLMIDYSQLQKQTDMNVIKRD